MCYRKSAANLDYYVVANLYYYISANLNCNVAIAYDTKFLQTCPSPSKLVEKLDRSTLSARLKAEGLQQDCPASQNQSYWKHVSSLGVNYCTPTNFEQSSKVACDGSICISRQVTFFLNEKSTFYGPYCAHSN